jgi:hypothetical protein
MRRKTQKAPRLIIEGGMVRGLSAMKQMEVPGLLRLLIAVLRFSILVPSRSYLFIHSFTYSFYLVFKFTTSLPAFNPRVIYIG